MPEALPRMALELEGQELQILGPFQGDMPNNTLVWIPSTRTLLAVDTVFADCYAWTANNSPEQSREWLRTLDRITVLRPEVVIPGHHRPGTPMTMAGIEHTRNYLTFFADVAASIRKSEEVIAAVRNRYPDLALPVALTLGARVATGEMHFD